MLQLIDNWRVAHKFTSIQLMAFAGVCDIILAGVVIVNQQFPFDPLWYVLGRLLLYTDPKSLPEIGDAQAAWDLYQRVWRPGKPHRQTWDDLYAVACKVATS